MRFVPIKSNEQQAVLSLHRLRQGFVKARTAQGNQIRGLLGELGLIIPKRMVNATKRVPTATDAALGNDKWHLGAAVVYLDDSCKQCQ
jgi:transposase